MPGRAQPDSSTLAGMSAQQEIEATKNVVLAQKIMKNLKNPIWNVPDVIHLEPSIEVCLGRCPGKCKGRKTSVILHSQKLPSMLSRRHALIKYDAEVKQWTINDLKVLLLNNEIF